MNTSRPPAGHWCDVAHWHPIPALATRERQRRQTQGAATCIPIISSGFVNPASIRGRIDLDDLSVPVDDHDVENGVEEPLVLLQSAPTSLDSGSRLPPPGFALRLSRVAKIRIERQARSLEDRWARRIHRPRRTVPPRRQALGDSTARGRRPSDELQSCGSWHGSRPSTPHRKRRARAYASGYVRK
jgi:hypothetical protein